MVIAFVFLVFAAYSSSLFYHGLFFNRNVIVANTLILSRINSSRYLICFSGLGNNGWINPFKIFKSRLRNLFGLVNDRWFGHF